MIDRKLFWNEAGKAGIVLGAVSLAYLMAGWGLGLLDKSSAALGIIANVTSVLLWIAKFAGCLYLMRFFMLNYAEKEDNAVNSDTFKFGSAVALTSALVYSAGYLAYMLFIQPDIFTEAIATMGSSLDSKTLEELNNIAPKLPTIGFFFNLLYCWVFGTIVSSIFSRKIPNPNPFKSE